MRTLPPRTDQWLTEVTIHVEAEKSVILSRHSIAASATPVLGNRFSPFLRGRGGKGMFALLGAWTGLTLWQAPLVVSPLLTIGTQGLRWREGWTLLLSGCLIWVLVNLKDGLLPGLFYPPVILSNISLAFHSLGQTLTRRARSLVRTETGILTLLDTNL